MKLFIDAANRNQSSCFTDMGFNRNLLPANHDGGFDFPIVDVNPASPIPMADPDAPAGSIAGWATVLQLPASTRSNECVPNGRRAINLEIVNNNPGGNLQWVGYRLSLPLLQAKYNFDAIRSVFLNLQSVANAAGNLMGVYSEVSDFALLSAGSDRMIWNVPVVENDSLIVIVQNYGWNGYVNILPFPFQVMFFNFNQEPIAGVYQYTPAPS